jgi:RNA polymerase sigma-70 factor (ECF subfamily)
MAMDVDDLVRQYFDRIHRTALVLTGNPWDADDLAQETFLILSRDSDRFGGRSSVFTWLYGILLNLERRQRRQAGTLRRKLQTLREQASERKKSNPSAETPIEVAEWKDSLWNHVASLPDGQRQAMVLRFSEGLQYQEIADVLDCPVGTAKTRVFHGLRKLRELIGDDDEQVRIAPKDLREDMTDAV